MMKNWRVIHNDGWCKGTVLTIKEKEGTNEK